MKLKVLLPLTIVLIIFQILIFQLRIFSFFHAVLITTWVIYYHFDLKPAVFFLIAVSIPFELLTFQHFGIFGFSFSLTLLILSLVQDFFHILKSNEDLSFFLIGLCCNTILFNLLSFIIIREFNLSSFIISIIVNLILTVFMSKLFKKKRGNGYVT